jgi:hypothetical protein
VIKGWHHKTFGKLGRVFNGNSISATEKAAHFAGLNEDIPYIATKDVGFDHTIQYESGVRIPENKNGDFKLAPSNSLFGVR